MNRENHKVLPDPCPKPALSRVMTRTWEGSHDGPTAAPDLAGGTTLRRNIGTEYNKGDPAERELPKVDSPFGVDSY